MTWDPSYFLIWALSSKFPSKTSIPPWDSTHVLCISAAKASRPSSRGRWLLLYCSRRRRVPLPGSGGGPDCRFSVQGFWCGQMGIPFPIQAQAGFTSQLPPTASSLYPEQGEAVAFYPQGADSLCFLTLHQSQRIFSWILLKAFASQGRTSRKWVARWARPGKDSPRAALRPWAHGLDQGTEIWGRAGSALAWGSHGD